jgi:hypothetical protein
MIILCDATASSLIWFAPVASLVVGLLLGLFTEPFRLWLLRPVLRATFTRDEHSLRETPVEMKRGEAVFESRAKVVRFFVYNKRRFLAKSCVVYLVSIERIAADGKATSLFADRIPLTWAYVGTTPLDVPGHTGLYCDVAGASQPVAQLIPHTEPKPKIFPTLLREHATYRFTAIVTGENVTPVTIRLCIAWKGDWDIEDVWEDTERT